MLYSQPLLPPLHAKTTMQIRSASNTNEVNWDDPLNKGLVAWYPMRQRGGNVLRDVVGDYDATFTGGGDEWVPSPQNHAIGKVFDGSDDQAKSSSTLSRVTTDAFTASIWFRCSDDVGGALLHTGTITSTNNRQWMVYKTTGTDSVNLYLANADGGGWAAIIETTLVVKDDVWRQVTCTYDGLSQTARVYMDGVDIVTGSTGTVPTVLRDSGRPLAFAQWGSGFLSFVASDTRIYNRALSESEVHDLYVASRTGYVDQFKRRSFPVGVTPTPTESHPSNGLIRLKSPKQTQPSYKAGYAKSASESANPNLWDGLAGAWVPRMGITGIERVLDVTGRNHGVIVGTEADDIKPNYLHLDADGGGTFGEYVRADQQQMTLPFTLTSRARLTDPAEPIIFFSAYKQGSASGRDYHRMLGLADGQIIINSRDQSASDTAASVSGLLEVGEWVNVTAVFREDRHDAYLNGRHVAGGTVAAGLTADMILVGTTRLDYSASSGTGDFSSVLYHDRELSLKEIQDLNADPLAPFRQRRYAPVSIQADAPSFNNWYAMPGRTNRIVGSGVHV